MEPPADIDPRYVQFLTARDSSLALGKRKGYKRITKALDSLTLSRGLWRACCDEDCVAHWRDDAGIQKILRWRQNYRVMSQGDQRQYLLDYLCECRTAGFHFKFDGVRVCQYVSIGYAR